MCFAPSFLRSPGGAVTRISESKHRRSAPTEVRAELKREHRTRATSGGQASNGEDRGARRACTAIRFVGAREIRESLSYALAYERELPYSKGRGHKAHNTQGTNCTNCNDKKHAARAGFRRMPGVVHISMPYRVTYLRTVLPYDCNMPNTIVTTVRMCISMPYDMPIVCASLCRTVLRL